MKNKKKPAPDRAGVPSPKEPGSKPVTDEERIDEASMESFPASDPPSFSGGIDRHD